jgi:hypothetical protein
MDLDWSLVIAVLALLITSISTWYNYRQHKLNLEQYGGSPWELTLLDDGYYLLKNTKPFPVFDIRISVSPKVVYPIPGHFFEIKPHSSKAFEIAISLAAQRECEFEVTWKRNPKSITQMWRHPVLINEMSGKGE